MPRSRALSLLEVVIALGVLALVAGSVALVYTGLMAGTRKADSNQEAVAALATVVDLWKISLHQNWPSTDPPDVGVPATVNGTLRQFAYSVDDWGRQVNPQGLNLTVTDPKRYLPLKKVIATLYYPDETAGSAINRTLSTVFYVAR